MWSLAYFLENNIHTSSRSGQAENESRCSRHEIRILKASLKNRVDRGPGGAGASHGIVCSFKLCRHTFYKCSSLFVRFLPVFSHVTQAVLFW